MLADKFTGKGRDAETGLDYFGARHFSGAQGRFSSPDPTPNGISVSDPQSWNQYGYVGNRPLAFVDRNGKWATPVHGDIVTIALQGYLSAGELRQLIGEQYVMDADQSAGGSYKHAMHAFGQSADDATKQMWEFVASNLGSSSIDALGDALHTIQDYTSPEHRDASFQPRMWPGAAGAAFLFPSTIAHVLGEDSPEVNWSRFGLAVRFSMAAFMQWSPKRAQESGLTDATFEAAYQRRITNFIDSYYSLLDLDRKNWSHAYVKADAARQCALGNPAACGF
jgi:RHS repeat-associated protein